MHLPRRSEARKVYHAAVRHVNCSWLVSRRRACCVLLREAFVGAWLIATGRNASIKEICHAAALVCSFRVAVFVLGPSLSFNHTKIKKDNQQTKTRTRTYTNLNGTEANAAGRSVCAYVARESKRERERRCRWARDTPDEFARRWRVR